MNYVNDLYIDTDNTCDDKATQDWLTGEIWPTDLQKINKIS